MAVVHVMKYLGGGAAEPAAAVEGELEEFLEQLQPGWATHVLARRFLPGMTVSHGLPCADGNGLSGRPSVTVLEHPNAFLAGDWVGAEGMLADASAASAVAAAQHVLALLARTPATEQRSAHHVAG